MNGALNFPLKILAMGRPQPPVDISLDNLAAET
jgi:hypothetical protein